MTKKETSLVLARDPDGMDPHLISVTKPASWEAETFRALRHVIAGGLQRATALGVELDEISRSARGRGSLLAVTSPAPGDGKTTISINLAASAAESPSIRVLLVDADMRCSNMENVLGLERDQLPSLVDAIEEPSLRLSDIVRQHSYLSFGVIPAGVARTNPYELLESTRAGQLLVEASEQYDLIIIDTPPMVAVTDAQALLRWVDRFVVVVAAHRTPRQALAQTLDALPPEKMFGLVYNGDEGAAFRGSLFNRYYSRRS